MFSREINTTVTITVLKIYNILKMIIIVFTLPTRTLFFKILGTNISVLNKILIMIRTNKKWGILLIAIIRQDSSNSHFHIEKPALSICLAKFRLLKKNTETGTEYFNFNWIIFICEYYIVYMQFSH